MMDDLRLPCCRKPEDFVVIQDEELGEVSIAYMGNIEATGVVLSKKDAMALHDWLIDYLRPFEADPVRRLAKAETSLRDAQAALTELMALLPELVRLADRKGVEGSEEHWLDRARTYIDIYEGRTNA